MPVLLVLSNFIWIMKLYPVKMKIQKKRHQADATPLHHEGCIDFPQKIVANKQQLLLYLDVFLSIQNNQFFTSISIQFKIKFQGAFLTAFSEVYESLLIKRSIVLHKKTA